MEVSATELMNILNKVVTRHPDLKTDGIGVDTCHSMVVTRPASWASRNSRTCGTTSKSGRPGFPEGAVVESPPADAGDTGSCPGLGGSHMRQSGWACEPWPLSLRVRSLCSAAGEAIAVRGPHTAKKKKKKKWQAIYKQFDIDCSGTIGSSELPGAFEAAGFRLNEHLYNMIIRHYSDEGGNMGFDNFISCLVRPDAMFRAFKSLDKDGTGQI